MSEHRHAASRGIAWREREILDLLSFWGEEKIQEALKSSYRNIDYFERIAAQMALRGHKRTAMECRSKTKTMRLDYKKVVAHNSTSGNAPITCPYFRELDSILRGDASVKPKRVSRSLGVVSLGRQLRDPCPVSDGSEELFSHDLFTIDHGQIRSSTPCQVGVRENVPEVEAEIDTDATVDGLEDKESDDPCPDGQEETISNNSSSTSGLGSSKESPLKSVAELSPGTRLSAIRSRRRRNAGLFSVADKMMSQSGEEHKAQINEWRIDRKDSNKWHEEERRLQVEFLEETRKERNDFRDVWMQNLHVMESAVTTLQTLGEMLVSQHRGRSANACEKGDSNSENIPPRSATAKRACVGRARERLTL
ncbi:myb/SANT-like DNA-binding domain-containing protein 7 [Eublepharis macularius]|uniref:Myb/SANT-like DNA-binding domain-containing protein 7 n=1 Tax=Eublepharis macularius TaxID=481883 RepID=A0AA97JQF7_EUBMA|nr:myb/SANT-like DNA-binding domain-containing protein 7 [Eublepharis macularius]XP_054828444.1 myb/SANT-like DNA-binding domain-containing protein 7 [Eublepharis macularius]XP_054834473.1 myb/SANT-like DNA-binding domain-containing protein 7 [Eublepharis macularius]XP_054840011.1 myb/SANT-like DNA-binding domain-containing protein 7 [Eublepharis macularius]XP_054841656.1 myb/SANT-like DNA-binding domain-containing protein 7 [Eublepharis macularius]XP_054851437.1 myb/SANT-like DNA-binding doma